MPTPTLPVAPVAPEPPVGKLGDDEISAKWLGNYIKQHPDVDMVGTDLAARNQVKQWQEAGLDVGIFDTNGKQIGSFKPGMTPNPVYLSTNVYGYGGERYVIKPIRKQPIPPQPTLGAKNAPTEPIQPADAVNVQGPVVPQDVVPTPAVDATKAAADRAAADAAAAVVADDGRPPVVDANGTPVRPAAGVVPVPQGDAQGKVEGQAAQPQGEGAVGAKPTRSIFTDLASQKNLDAATERLKDAKASEKPNGWEIIKDGESYALRNPKTGKIHAISRKLKTVRDIAKQHTPEERANLVSEKRSERASETLAKAAAEGKLDEYLPPEVGLTPEQEAMFGINQPDVAEAVPPVAAPTTPPKSAIPWDNPEFLKHRQAMGEFVDSRKIGEEMDSAVRDDIIDKAVARAIKGYDPEQANGKTIENWIIGIVKQDIKKALGKKSIFKNATGEVGEIPDTRALPDAEAAAKEQDIADKKSIDSLSDSQKKYLLYIENEKITDAELDAEIAKFLGMKTFGKKDVKQKRLANAIVTGKYEGMPEGEPLKPVGVDIEGDAPKAAETPKAPEVAPESKFSSMSDKDLSDHLRGLSEQNRKERDAVARPFEDRMRAIDAELQQHYTKGGKIRLGKSRQSEVDRLRSERSDVERQKREAVPQSNPFYKEIENNPAYQEQDRRNRVKVAERNENYARAQQEREQQLVVQAAEKSQQLGEGDVGKAAKAILDYFDKHSKGDERWERLTDAEKAQYRNSHVVGAFDSATKIKTALDSGDIGTIHNMFLSKNPMWVRAFESLTGERMPDNKRDVFFREFFGPGKYDAWKTEKQAAIESKEADEKKKTEDANRNSALGKMYGFRPEGGGETVNMSAKDSIDKLLSDGYLPVESQRGAFGTMKLVKGNRSYEFRGKYERQYIEEQTAKPEEDVVTKDDASEEDLNHLFGVKASEPKPAAPVAPPPEPAKKPFGGKVQITDVPWHEATDEQRRAIDRSWNPLIRGLADLEQVDREVGDPPLDAVQQRMARPSKWVNDHLKILRDLPQRMAAIIMEEGRYADGMFNKELAESFPEMPDEINEAQYTDWKDKAFQEAAKRAQKLLTKVNGIRPGDSVRSEGIGRSYQFGKVESFEINSDGDVEAKVKTDEGKEITSSVNDLVIEYKPEDIEPKLAEAGIKYDPSLDANGGWTRNGVKITSATVEKATDLDAVGLSDYADQLQDKYENEQAYPAAQPAATSEAKADWNLLKSGSLSGSKERDRFGLPFETIPAISVLDRGPATPSRVMEEMRQANQRTGISAYDNYNLSGNAIKALDQLVELGLVEKTGENDWDHYKQRFKSEATYKIAGEAKPAVKSEAKANPTALDMNKDEFHKYRQDMQAKFEKQHGKEWSNKYFQAADRLFPPGDVAEYRTAGIVTEEDGRYTLHVLSDIDMPTKRWRVAYVIDVTEQFVKPAATASDAKPAAKEPWQMTRDEFVKAPDELATLEKELIAAERKVVEIDKRKPKLGGNANDHARWYSDRKVAEDELTRLQHIQRDEQRAFEARKPMLERMHRESIIKASEAGKPIPPEVLAAYPDLAPKRSMQPAKEPVAPPSESAPPATASDAKPAAKEPWQATPQEVADRWKNPISATDEEREPWMMPIGAWNVWEAAIFGDKAKAPSIRQKEWHKGIVRDAHAAGKPVPPEVLADDPDLAPKSMQPANEPVANSDEVVPLPSDPYVKAEKQPNGKFKLFYIGTQNEVFPGETFTSSQEARAYLGTMRYKAKGKESLSAPTEPAPTSPKVGEKRSDLDIANEIADSAKGDKNVDQDSPIAKGGAAFRNHWMESETFHLTEVPIDSIEWRGPAGKTYHEPKSNKPIVLDKNRRDVGYRDDLGRTPNDTVLDGQNRLEQARQRGDKTILAWVGDKVIEKKPAYTPEQRSASPMSVAAGVPPESIVADKPDAKPFGDVPVEDESKHYGAKVKVSGVLGAEDYEGTVTRVLNNGAVVEVKPSGDDSGATFRVKGDRVEVLEPVKKPTESATRSTEPPPRAEPPEYKPEKFTPPSIEDRKNPISDEERATLETQSSELQNRRSQIEKDLKHLKSQHVRANAHKKLAEQRGNIRAKEEALGKADRMQRDIDRRFSIERMEKRADEATDEASWLSAMKYRESLLADEIKETYGNQHDYNKTEYKKHLDAADRYTDRLKEIVAKAAEFVKPELNKDEFNSVIERAGSDNISRDLHRTIRVEVDRTIEARKSYAPDLEHIRKESWQTKPEPGTPYSFYPNLSAEQRAKGVEDIAEAIKHPDWYQRVKDIKDRLEGEHVGRKKIADEEARIKREKDAADATKRADEVAAGKQAREKERRGEELKTERFWKSIKAKAAEIKKAAEEKLAARQQTIGKKKLTKDQRTKDTVEVRSRTDEQTGKDDNGKPIYKETTETKPAVIIDDNWAIAENWKGSNPPKDSDSNPQFSLIHRKSGWSLGSGNKEGPFYELVALLQHEGVDASDAMSNKATKSQLQRVHRAWDRSDVSELGEERSKEILAQHGMPESITKATVVMGQAEMGEGIGRIQNLAAEVPEFAYDPVMTVDKNGGLVYRDGYKYTFPKGSFGTNGMDLKPGDTVGFNLEDLGIKRKTPQDVVADQLEVQGFKVTRGKDAITIKRKGTTIKVIGEGEKWTADMDKRGFSSERERQEVQDAINAIRWKQPEIEASMREGMRPESTGMKGSFENRPASEAMKKMYSLGVSREEDIPKAEFVQKLKGYQHGELDIDDRPLQHGEKVEWQRGENKLSGEVVKVDGDFVTVHPDDPNAVTRYPMPGDQIKWNNSGGMEITGEVVKVLDGGRMTVNPDGTRNNHEIDPNQFREIIKRGKKGLKEDEYATTTVKAEDIFGRPVDKGWYSSEYQKAQYGGTGKHVKKPTTVEAISKATGISVKDLNAYAESGKIPGEKPAKSPRAADAAALKDAIKRLGKPGGPSSSSFIGITADQVEAIKDIVVNATKYTYHTVEEVVKAIRENLPEWKDSFEKDIRKMWDDVHGKTPEPPKVETPEPPKATEPPKAGTPEQPGPEERGIKNAYTERRREEEGLPEREQVERRVWETTKKEAEGLSDDAVTKIVRDVGTRDLVKEPNTELEGWVVGRRTNEIENRLTKARASGDKEAIAAAQVDLAEILGIDERIGSEAGRILGQRRAEWDADFSLTGIARRWIRGKKGPLSEAEWARAEKLANEIKAAQDVISEAENNSTKDPIDKAIDEAIKNDIPKETPEEKISKIIKDAKKKPKAEPVPEKPIEPEVKSLLERIMDKWEKSAQASRDWLSTSSFFSFPLNPEAIVHLANVGAYHLSRGILDIPSWTAAMVKEVGEKFKAAGTKFEDYRDQIWEASNKAIDKSVDEDSAPADKRSKAKEVIHQPKPKKPSTPADKQPTKPPTKKPLVVPERNDTDRVFKFLRQIQREVVEGGIRDREKVVDAVWEEAKNHYPDMERDEVRTIVSGYGRSSPAPTSEITKTIIDINRQLQIQQGTEATERGEKPLKTGDQMVPPTDIQRQLTKERAEGLKKPGLRDTAPGRTLKSAEDAAITAIKNQMFDLQWEIDNKRRIVKDRFERQRSTAEETMRQQLADLKVLHDAIYKTPKDKENLRNLAIGRALDKAIETMEANNKAGNIDRPEKLGRKDTPENVVKRARLDLLRLQREELRTDSPEFQTNEIARRLASYKKILTKQEKSLLSRKAEMEATGEVPAKIQRSMATKLDKSAREQKQRILDLKEEIVDMERALRANFTERAASFLGSVVHGNVFSSAGVVEHIGGAVLWKIPGMIVDELSRSLLSKVPGFRKFAGPLEGRGDVVKFLKELGNLKQTGRNMADQMLHHGSALQREFGKKFPKPVWAIPKPDASEGKRKFLKIAEYATEGWGRMHAVMKEVERSPAEALGLSKVMADAKENGVDVNDPKVQERIADVVDWANRQILMQERNPDTIHRRWTAKVDPETGRKSVLGLTKEVWGHGIQPVFRVGMNFASEVMERLLGVPAGLTHLAWGRKIYGSLMDIPEKQRQDIARKFVYGVSALPAMFALGWYGYKHFGGYYIGQDRPKEQKLDEGEIEFGDVKVSKELTYSPMIGMLQAMAQLRYIWEDHKNDTKKQHSLLSAAARTGAAIYAKTPIGSESKVLTDLGTPERVEHALGQILKTMVIPGMVAYYAKHTDKDAYGNLIKRDTSKDFSGPLYGAIPGLRRQLGEKKKKSMGTASPYSKIWKPD